MNPSSDREKKRFRLPERIKQQNEAILRRKLERATPKTRPREKEDEPSVLKLVALLLGILGLVYLGVRYGIRLPR